MANLAFYLHRKHISLSRSVSISRSGVSFSLSHHTIRCTFVFCTIRLTFCILCLPLLQSFYSRNKNDKARVLHTHTHSRARVAVVQHTNAAVCVCAFVVTAYTIAGNFSFLCQVHVHVHATGFYCCRHSRSYFVFIQPTIHLASIASQQVHCISLN